MFFAEYCKKRAGFDCPLQDHLQTIKKFVHLLLLSFMKIGRRWELEMLVL